MVVLETGTAVTMPWAGSGQAELFEAWFAGSRGAEAVANIIFGDVNPSAKLPMTFSRSEADLPHPDDCAAASGHSRCRPARLEAVAAGLPRFQVAYDEGVKVGYKWYDAENKPVLYPFGYSMSYTSLFVLGSESERRERFHVTSPGTPTRAAAGEQEVAEVSPPFPPPLPSLRSGSVGFGGSGFDAGRRRNLPWM